MNSSITQTYRAVRLPDSVVQKDIAAADAFLSEDYPATAAFAQASGEAVFICGASSPLITRKRIFHDWRAAQIIKLRQSVPVFEEYLNGAVMRGERESIMAGEVALKDLDIWIDEFAGQRHGIMMMLLRASKAALRKAVAEALEDPKEAGEEEDANQVPRFLVIRGDGAGFKLFRHRASAKAWGNLSRKNWMMLDIDVKSCGIHTPEPQVLLADAPAENAHEVAADADPKPDIHPAPKASSPAKSPRTRNSGDDLKFDIE